MKQFYNRHRITILLLLFLLEFIGLYTSRAILSIFPYVLLFLGLVNDYRWVKIKQLLNNRALLSVILIFFVYVISGVNSDNTLQWLKRVEINISFLVIPLGIYLSGPYTKLFIKKTLSLFVLVSTIISAFILIKYVFNFSEINQSYFTGKTIWTPIAHVRYSYFIALAILFSTYLYITKFQFKFPWERYLYGFTTVFLLLFIHILAVRTGLVSLYITAFIMVLYYMMKFKKYKLGITTIGILVAVLILSAAFFPSFKNKLNYSRYDITSTINNTSQYHTSDRIRIYSILNGFRCLKESPLLGTGIGDIEEVMYWKYEDNYPDLPKEMRFQPINQFVYILASMGILGFILYFGLLIYPFFTIRHKHILLLPLYLLTFSTFIGETTIELMIGKSGFLVLLSLLICYEDNPKNTISNINH